MDSTIELFMEEKLVECMYEYFLVLRRVSDFVLFIVMWLPGVSWQLNLQCHNKIEDGDFFFNFSKTKIISWIVRSFLSNIIFTCTYFC